MPPHNVATTKAMRTRLGSTLRYSAIPLHTPHTTQSLAPRRNRGAGCPPAGGDSVVEWSMAVILLSAPVCGATFAVQVADGYHRMCRGRGPRCLTLIRCTLAAGGAY